MAPPLTAPPQAIFSESFKTNRPLIREAFYKTILSLEDKILRMKGYIDFGEGPMYIELVGDEILEKKLEKQSQNETAFVVIAWNIRQEELRKIISEIL